MQLSQSQLENQVTTFNEAYKPGQKVEVMKTTYSEDTFIDEIQSPASIVGGHTAMAWLKEAGSYDLTFVKGKDKHSLCEKKIELNKKSEFIFHLENDEGENMTYGMSLATVEVLCQDSVYEGLETDCTSSSCNNESQNFCDCGSEFEDYEIKSVSIKQN